MSPFVSVAWASGTTWAVESVTPNTANFLNTSWRFGYTFTVGASALTVTHLRVWPDDGAGTSSRWRLIIHRNSDEAVMVSQDIIVPANEEHVWHEYELASSVTLAASTDYTISARARNEADTANKNTDLYRNPDALTYASGITNNGGVYGGSNDDRPTTTSTSEYWTMDFGWS